MTQYASRPSRRLFLRGCGVASASLLFAASAKGLNLPQGSELRPAYELLYRVLGPQARQIHLALRPSDSPEQFRITGERGDIRVEASSRSALLMGVHWYLRHVAGVSISWNGDCLGFLPSRLPAPAIAIQRRASVSHRFALNDTNDGYTGPYWKWPQWERLIDVLALHGINEVFLSIGAEAVYQQTFQQFHYTPAELRAWFPMPAHQPWWLLQNMSGWVGPSVPQQLIDSRVVLAAKITSRLRELGMQPVLPGYYGIVPPSFADKNEGSHIVGQGNWLGMPRPDWLDPTSEIFSRVAEVYYREQRRLLGPTTFFKMDPLHEGGLAGDINIRDAAAQIDKQLQRANPGATWVLLGWQHNPSVELLSGIADKKHALVVDGLSDRQPHTSRESEWSNTPYAFGSIWNFGGHTSMGANMGVWNERFFDQLHAPGSKLSGIAVLPEASCNNPAALSFLTDLPWLDQRPVLSDWFAQWSATRYGRADVHAAAAWDILRATAYNGSAGEWSEPQDNLFTAQPSLTATNAATWSPKEPRYDLGHFSKAVFPLLDVQPMLRSSSAYRYDLVDVARQTISNYSRILLPHIKNAYELQNISDFRSLTRQWLNLISLLNQVVGAENWFMLGPWLESAREAMTYASEQAEFDATSILLEWGPRVSEPSGVHDYGNREWNGLLEFYRYRWQLYFESLERALVNNEAPAKIDWFAVNEQFSKLEHSFAKTQAGDVHELVGTAIRNHPELSVLPTK